MRYFYLLTLTFILSTASAQDVKTTYHDVDNTILETALNSKFYRNIYLDTILNNTSIYRLEEYYSNNKPKQLAYTTNDIYPFKYFLEKQEYYEEGTIKSFEKYHISGEQIDTAWYFYPNNKLMLVTYLDPRIPKSERYKQYLAYFDTLQHSILKNGSGYIKFDLSGLSDDNEMVDYEEGNLLNFKKNGLWKGRIEKDYTFEEIYKDGLLVKGKTTSSDGDVYTYNSFNENNRPIKNIESLMRNAMNKSNFPRKAINAGVNGTISTSFNIEKDGSITNIRVLSDLGYGTKEYAINVLEKLDKKIIPRTNRGIPTQISFLLPIFVDSSLY